jgi:hypothetical protein
VAEQALTKLGDSVERVRSIEHTLSEHVGLYTAARLVKELGYEHGMYSSADDARPAVSPLIPKEKVEDLANLVVQRIETAASDGSLAADPSFMGVVGHWSLLGGVDHAVQWVRQFAVSDENLVKIIRQTKGEARSREFTDRVIKATSYVNCDYLSSFVPAQEARRRCSDILAACPNWLTAEDRESLQAVVAAIAEDGTIRELRPGTR